MSTPSALPASQAARPGHAAAANEPSLQHTSFPAVGRHSSGSFVRQVSQSGQDVADVQWRPGASETLAYDVDSETVNHSQLFVLAIPSMTPRLILTARFFNGFIWSPSGASLAVASVSAPPEPKGLLQLVPASGGAATTVLSSSGNGFEPAAWWPDRRGVLYWFDEDFSASIAADGLRLDSIDLSTGKSTTLATALTYRNWLAWAPAGSAVAIVAGSDRTS